MVVLAGYDAIMISLSTEIVYAEHFYTCEVERVKKRGNVIAVDVSKFA